MRDEIDRLRGVIKDAREMVEDWASMVSGYGNKETQLQIANNEKKPDRTNFDTSSIPAGNIFEEIMSEEIKKTWT